MNNFSYSKVPFCGDGSEAASFIDSAKNSVTVDCSEVSINYNN